jgi:hypothetical protein
MVSRTNEFDNELNRDFCDLCDLQNIANIACKQCLVKLCEHHQKNHIVTKTTKHHELVPLDEMDSDTVLALDSSHRFVKYGENCVEHKTLLADKYCQECEDLCCSDCCFASKHSDHRLKVVPLKELHPTMVSEFKDELIPQTNATLEYLYELDT